MALSLQNLNYYQLEYLSICDSHVYTDSGLLDSAIVKEENHSRKYATQKNDQINSKFLFIHSAEELKRCCYS